MGRWTTLAGLALFVVLAGGCVRWVVPAGDDPAVAVIRRKDVPLTLVGRALRVGDRLPNVALTGNAGELVPLSRFWGAVMVISTVPSLGTPVCQSQTSRFTEEIGKLAGAVRLVTISADPAEMQNRFCAARHVGFGQFLSDPGGLTFGRATGLRVRELDLLARAAMVVDARGIIRYIQVVPDLAQEPDYESVLAAVQRVLRAEGAAELEKRSVTPGLPGGRPR
jgi:thiol peroxidase